MMVIEVGSYARAIFAMGLLLPFATAWCASDLAITKQVVPQVPTAGESVEFEIVVRNEGPDDVEAIHVTEHLPSELELPLGMAVFTSQGSYDPDEGDWSVGDLNAGAVATMTVPAQRVGAAPPPCVVNTASLRPVAGDPVAGNDSASAGVRQPGVERCVDLVVENVLFSVPQPFCSNSTHATLSLFIHNNGPDDARAVSIALAQTPARLPNLRFSDTECSGVDPSRCEIATIDAGRSRVIDVVSDDFNNTTPYTVSLRIDVSSADFDYIANNNFVSIEREVPITITPPCDIPLPSGAGAPSCFVATAAWGQPWDDNVLTLREFRDHQLLTHAAGRSFVAWYYRRSPALADHIADRPVLRALTRAMLTPVVLTIRHPVAAPMMMILCAALGFIIVLRNLRRRSAGVTK